MIAGICAYFIGLIIAVILGQYIIIEDKLPDAVDNIMLVILGLWSWISVIVLLGLLFIKERDNL